MRLMRNGLVCLAAAAALAGCGVEGEEPTPLTDRELVQSGSRFETPTVVGDLFATGRPTGPDGEGGSLPVNKYLWRASLQTLEFLPLASTDPFSGVIVTDWSSSAQTPDERFKVTAYITDYKLEARSLRVAVYREVKSGDGAWAPADVSDATPRRLEDAILTRARQLRVAELEADG